MNTALPLLSHTLRMQYEPAQSVWMLHLPDGAMQLNDSAAEIMRRCDGRHTVAAIVTELEELFETEGIAPQVQSLIDEGTRRGWFV
ncbi:pyrroloquinoline quinone biosynthesis peptide chaperone PqqD [Diaphorobacter caeni]|uniref:pyrroloquinoline quinone biosynthesis peptide chaperone PqqD n=1 Tax=Diaphorobacter caeni TaxID=2784387 RepID=UPI00188DD278|nr:pyrroloquinoline quinone biosynthesis peptide chaperone PqqD [Diaphorobacter caeni]MBF5005164.1 pyrroloquinoline quinone biosynthesis peptide chaperone PqqD [Diaphorobacter caeni]